jgi:small-conductance mechanosensitive channel
MEIKQWTATLMESMSRAAIQVLDYLPLVLGAAVLLLLGWAVARMLRYATRHIVERMVNRIARTRPMDTRVQQPQTYSAAPVIASRIVFWVVLLFFVLAATEVLHLQVITNLLAGVTAYLPQLLAGLLIIFVGLWLAEFTRAVLSRTGSSLGMEQGELLGRTGQILVLLAVFSIAAGQVGIDNTLLVILVAMLFGISFGGVALAFALGARSTISNLLGRHSIAQIYSVGDIIRIDNHEGKIMQITRTGVILETPEGPAQIPGQRFSEEVSVHVSKTDTT